MVFGPVKQCSQVLALAQCLTELWACIKVLFLIRNISTVLKPGTGWLRFEILGVCRGICVLCCHGLW